MFWEMTLAELQRRFESYKRIRESQQREKANFDYILADLIGISIGRIYDKHTHYPKIEEVYTALFNEEIDSEREQEEKDKKNIARFREFANSFNKRWEEAKE